MRTAIIKKNTAIHRSFILASIILLIFLMTSQLTISFVNASNDQNVKYQSLNTTKASFILDMENQLEYYNAQYGTQVVLEKNETYLPLPKGLDGWYRYYNDGFGSLALGGPESNIEEVYYFVYLQHNDTKDQEAKIARYAFEETLLHDQQQRILSDNWLDHQLSSNVIENRTVIGDRTLWFLSAPGENPYYCFGILGAPEPPPPGFSLPWWTILSIVSATIGISGFAFKIYQHFSNKQKKINRKVA